MNESNAVTRAASGGVARTGRIALQAAALGVLWMAVDWPCARSGCRFRPA